MRTKASFKGHPIHALLIPFPIAFFVGALTFDILGIVLEKQSFWMTAFYLGIAGVVMGLITAIPGFIDFVYSVPPNSSGKDRALKHGSLNVLVVIIFAVVLGIRGSEDIQPGTLVLFMEFAAVICLSISGWLGGTLATRNLIGPDHRYANAGKWKDESFEEKKGTPIKIASSDELKVDQMKLIRIGEKRIVLGRTENGYTAFDDRCTHRGGSLAGGVMVSGVAQCLWHGSQFDTMTGQVKAGPAKDPISTYRVEVKDGSVYLVM